MIVVSFVTLVAGVANVEAFATPGRNPLERSTRQWRRRALRMVVELHGTQGSRSPLINWYLEEREIKYEMKPPLPSNHPFGQVPYLVDGDVEVFESGAILLYLADKYELDTPEKRARFTKWVVWANASLDPICFVENDRGQVMGTKLDQSGRAVAVLEQILSENEWLADDSFSVADVAVASYLNYVPLFFPSVDLRATPAMSRYMLRCSQRPAFVKAFGEGHANAVAAAVERAGAASQSKRFGLF
mmetsp:Transcript_17424/g.54429  ORF Transcript_17424/g.54429 Transcript_17424/m.54429 type:complete len:245 (-) Transcript_17424:236-970(-)